MFRVGQKVVCVDDGQSSDVRKHKGSYWAPNYPVKGDVYTIRDVKDVGVLLVEVINPLRDFRDGLQQEAHFRHSRFRPVVERKTDISIFTAMLNPAKKKRRADRPVTVS